MQTGKNVNNDVKKDSPIYDSWFWCSTGTNVWQRGGIESIERTDHHT